MKTFQMSKHYSSPNDNILSLSEDLIGRILFSGYLSISWHSIVSTVLICRSFLALGRKYISYVDHKRRIFWNCHTKHAISLNVLDIRSLAENLVFLDLSFCEIEFDERLANMLLSWKKTLRGLSLRSTSVKDLFIKVIGEMEGLRFLDISKREPSQRESITDACTIDISKLKNLKWLNLAMTNVTDNTIVAIQKSCPFLEHVALQCCPLLTDASLVALSHMKIVTLDISNCPLLSSTGMELFCSKSSTIHRYLEVLAVSYLPKLSVATWLPVLLQFPRLQKLEFRKKSLEKAPEEIVQYARQVRKMILVLTHKDQLNYVEGLSIIEAGPLLSAVCPIFCWPYKAIKEL